MRGAIRAVAAALILLTGCSLEAPSIIVSETAVSNHDAMVLVSGWQPAELTKILTDFERKYELGLATLVPELLPNGSSRITFRQPVDANYLFFLVNYLHYPEGIDLTHRSPTAVAVIRLGPAFGVKDHPLLGRTAAVYVPLGDTEYDEVYVRVDDGSAYRVPFTDLGWRPEADARRSKAVAALQALASIS